MWLQVLFGNLLAMSIPWSHSGPTESETLGIETRIGLCLTSPSDNYETHWSDALFKLRASIYQFVKWC